MLEPETTLRIRFACESPLSDGFALVGTSICDDTADLRGEIDKTYVRELALSGMLDKLSDSLHEQDMKVLRPGVRIGTYVTCEHCKYCKHLPARPNWISCRLDNFRPTISNSESLSFFCADGEPKEEQNATDKM